MLPDVPYKELMLLLISKNRRMYRPIMNKTAVTKPPVNATFHDGQRTATKRAIDIQDFNHAQLNQETYLFTRQFPGTAELARNFVL